MAQDFATGSVVQSLADHVREFKMQAFDFGPYNHVRYDQAPKGAALVRCAPYLMRWLRAGLAKVHVQMLRNILKLLEVKFAHEFPSTRSMMWISMVLWHSWQGGLT